MEIRLIKAFNILNTNQRVIHCGVVPGCYFTVIKPVSRHRNAIQKSITPEIPSALITRREVTYSIIPGASCYKGHFFWIKFKKKFQRRMQIILKILIKLT